MAQDADSPLARLAELTRAHRAIQHAHNIKRGGRTRHARVRDAIRHAEQSNGQKNAGGKPARIVFDADITLSESPSHPPSL